MSSKRTCYACDEPATSREHSPPLVFFPEAPDVGADHRVNLIRVPSCRAHNESRSEDDAYVAYMVCVCLENNNVALSQVASKVKRAIAKDPGVVARMFEGASPTEVDGVPTAAVKMDLVAFRRVMTDVARGLFFYCTGEKLTRTMWVVSPQLSDSGEQHPDWEAILENLERQPWEEGDRCENPAVFSYRWIQAQRAFRFCFYEGFTVYVLPEPEESPGDSDAA